MSRASLSSSLDAENSGSIMDSNGRHRAQRMPTNIAYAPNSRSKLILAYSRITIYNYFVIPAAIRRPIVAPGMIL